MRGLFAHQPEADCEAHTRSPRIGGHCASIRLEAACWIVLEEAGGDEAREGATLGKFLATFCGEVRDPSSEMG